MSHPSLPVLSFGLVRVSTSLALLVAAAATGCGGVEGDADPIVDPEQPADETSPEVRETAPAAGAIGVTADQAIVVTFSESMDAPSVEAAYTSTDLPPDAVTFAWNATTSVLTITPTAPLAYAQGIGTDLGAVARKSYAIEIGTGAMDQAGNPLASPHALTFATRRRMLANFPINGDMTRVLRNNQLLAAANPMWMGDNSAGEVYRSHVTFDLATLPAGSEIEGAEISARQAPPTGVPYNLGDVLAEHIVYPAMIDAIGATALSSPGAFSTDATIETKRIDVTAQVQDDVANRATRGDRAQFRLRFDQGSNANASTDVAVFDKTTLSMVALYSVE